MHAVEQSPTISSLTYAVKEMPFEDHYMFTLLAVGGITCTTSKHSSAVMAKYIRKWEGLISAVVEWDLTTQENTSAVRVKQGESIFAELNRYTVSRTIQLLFLFT